MKISLVSRLDSPSQKWHSQQLRRAAINRGIKFEVINPLSFNLDRGKFNSTDIVLWRSSNISNVYPSLAERIRLLSYLHHQGIIVVNNTLWTNPYLSYKSIQQEYVRQRLSRVIKSIPTYRAKNPSDLKLLIKNKTLNYPFIAKLNYGSQGRGALLISNPNDLQKIHHFNNYIYQNFIPNDGDYRILVVGGVSIVVIKRMRKKHPFLNNISQGGQAVTLPDSQLREKLANMASKISTNLDLTLAGVDLIYHQKEKEWYFLEVNTVFQWQGAQKLPTLTLLKKSSTPL